MSIVSRIIGKLLKLPPALTFNVNITKDINITMADGVKLLTDHYQAVGYESAPTVLIRLPYGKNQMGTIFSRSLAERGFQVICQNCRGTFGSEGTFTILLQEKNDGLATVEWIKQQDWFNGELATTGMSYLGYTQWALAEQAGAELKAMSMVVTTSAFHKQFYMGRSFSFEAHLGWSLMMRNAHKSKMIAFGNDKKVTKASLHLPVLEADERACGSKIKIWRDAIEHCEPNYEHWQPADHSASISKIPAPKSWTGGWYDQFLPWMLDDYNASREAGQDPYLIIGPWAHTSRPLMAEGLRQLIAWNKAVLLDDKTDLRASPVRLFVMGSEKWKDFPQWPPEQAENQIWHLHADGVLSPEAPTESSPSQYRYNPADPTPNVGGAIMAKGFGPKDNRKLEARPDVLVFTSHPLKGELEIIGSISISLYVRSSLSHTDFFARLCDVFPSGKSVNISDGLLRLRPGDFTPDSEGRLQVCFELWPTAYCFKSNHRLRLQVSSGAHPRYIRNMGSGEPIATAETLLAADQEVFHDPGNPSAITLPIMS